MKEQFIPYQPLEQFIPIPKAIIQLALSNARNNSEISDGELADLIELYLYLFMKDRNIAIFIDNRCDDAHLLFDSSHIVESD